MSKIDASELIKSLEGSLEEAEDALKLSQETIKKCERDILLYRYLLSLVKYEDDSVGVSNIVPLVQYNKPEYINEDGSVNWSKVPVDTKVEVKDSVGGDWKKRLFNSYKVNKDFPYKTFCDGDNSNNSDMDDYVGWMYCRLI